MTDIHILGAGAMGSLWTTYFHPLVTASQARITLIVRNTKPWQSTPNEIRCLPDEQSIHVTVTDTVKTKTIHKLIVATKAQHALQALQSIQGALSDDCEILLLQNGMGSQEQIAATFPNHSVYACSSTEGAYKKDLNTVVHAGQGENHIGAMTEKAQKECLEKWLPANKFSWHSDIQPVLWRKLVINAAINPLTVYYQCQNGQLLKNPKAKQHMADLCSELDSLVKAKQLAIHHTFSLAESVCQQTAENYSSMYKDIEAGRQTEIDFINGYVVKEGAELGVDCSSHQKLVSYIKGLSL